MHGLHKLAKYTNTAQKHFKNYLKKHFALKIMQTVYITVPSFGNWIASNYYSRYRMFSELLLWGLVFFVRPLQGEGTCLTIQEHFLKCY